jgi:tRNA threonylcarbamoyladenosine biosynthesis protein TsaB
MPTASLLLALDAGSPWVSAALARGGTILAERAAEMERSAGQLLEMTRDLLAEVGARPADLGGVVALRGPGSFTGLRIGLATVLGFHQSLGIPATALDTLQVLAAAASSSSSGGGVMAIVDALRGDWSAQVFTVDPHPRPLTGMELLPGSRLPDLLVQPGAGSGSIIGFGAARLANLSGWPTEIRLEEPTPAHPLASIAARLASGSDAEWDATRLTSPLYSRPAAISLPRSRRPAPAGSSAARP